MENVYLTREQQNELVKRSLSGDEAATVEIINFMTPFAGKFAMRFVNQEMQLEDLMQEAICGILQAIPRYEPDKGFKFSTYCTYWINKRIYKCASDRMIRIPDNRVAGYRNYISFVSEYAKEHGFEPSTDEIIEELGITKEKLKDFKDLPASYLILDEVPVVNKMVSEGFGESVITRLIIEEALLVCSESEQEIIKLHWGLDGYIEHTFQEIADMFGYTKEWARQKEKSGLKKIKRYLEKAEVGL